MAGRRALQTGAPSAPAGPVSARRGGFGAVGRSYFLPLALQSNPPSLLSLTLGSTLGWLGLRAARGWPHLSNLRVLADLLCGTNFEGVFARPSNPGSRRLAAHHHLLGCSLSCSTLCASLNALLFRRCAARLRDSLQGWQPSWALHRPTPRAAHAEPRLVARRRRREERGRAARAR